MPKLLTNGHKMPKEEMRELIELVKPEALRERLLKVWAKWCPGNVQRCALRVAGWLVIY